MTTQVTIALDPAVDVVDFMPFERTSTGIRYLLAEVGARRVDLTAGLGTLVVTDPHATLADGWRTVERAAGGAITAIRPGVIIPVGATTAYAALVDIDPSTLDPAVGVVEDGDYGDVVVTVDGTVWTIDAAVLSTFMRTVLDDVDAATARTTLGAQAASAVLAAYAAGASPTLAFLSLADDVTTAAMRTTLAAAGLTSTETLTNKRITPRAVTLSAVSDVFTIDLAATDVALLTGGWGGSPTKTITTTGSTDDGALLVIRMKDAGTSRALTWNAIFRVMTGVTLTANTVVNKWHYITCRYNSADTKLDVLQVLVQP